MERPFGGEACRVIAEASHGRLRALFCILAAFAAVTSGWEAYAQHLRGAYNDWLMWTPVALAPPMVVAALVSILRAKVARTLLPWLSVLVLIDGIVGFIFHLRGVGRLPGGFRLAVYNITMGPPIFAPLFFLIVGVLGLLAAALRPVRLRRLT
ncbi:MAG: hypothetical protein ACRDIY_23355 [Chloroflexota bacterium]